MLSNHPNWLFVTFTKGAFGHQLGRVLMTSPDVHYYDHPVNGPHPWSWNHFPADTGWHIAPAHFLRAFSDKNKSFRMWDFRISVPTRGIIYDEDFAFPDDAFQKKELIELLDEKKLVVPGHETPEYIRERFPNASIVSIKVQNEDWINVAKNQITATGNFKAFLKGTKSYTEEKQRWHTNTHQSSNRDWQRYSMNLNEEEWVRWTINYIKELDQSINVRPELINYQLQSTHRQNVDELIKMFEVLNLRYNREDIIRVLNSFNLEYTIKKFL